MPAKFVVKKGPTGKFRFSVVAANGEIVATSRTYDSRAGAMRGVQALRRAAGSAQVDDQTVAAKTAPPAKAKAAPKGKMAAKAKAAPPVKAKAAPKGKMSTAEAPKPTI